MLDVIRLSAPPRESSIVPLLKSLEHLVTAHLALEESVLYPALKSSASPILRRKAARYRAHMVPIGDTFIQTCREWQETGAISADPSRFVDEWTAATETFRMRMESEDEDLYALAEALAERT